MDGNHQDPHGVLLAEIFTPEVYGKAMGFVSGSGYFVAAFATKIFGMLVVVNANGTKDYQMGWIFIALCTLAGIVAASFIRPYRSVKPAFEATVSVSKA